MQQKRRINTGNVETKDLVYIQLSSCIKSYYKLEIIAFKAFCISTTVLLASTRGNFFDFSAPGHCFGCLLHCGNTQASFEIMQHMHMHKAVTGRVEAKKLTLFVESNRIMICFTFTTLVLGYLKEF